MSWGGTSQQQRRSIAAVMQVLLEKRRQQEAEQAEEQHKWELKMRVRDEEIGRRDEYTEESYFHAVKRVKQGDGGKAL